MTKIVTSFDQFISNLSESDGFGTSPFLLEKSGDVYHYFFNLDQESSDDQIGFHLIVGKYSDKYFSNSLKISVVIKLALLNLKYIKPLLKERNETTAVLISSLLYFL